MLCAANAAGGPQLVLRDGEANARELSAAACATSAGRLQQVSRRTPTTPTVGTQAAAVQAEAPGAEQRMVYCLYDPRHLQVLRPCAQCVGGCAPAA